MRAVKLRRGKVEVGEGWMFSQKGGGRIIFVQTYYSLFFKIVTEEIGSI